MRQHKLSDKMVNVRGDLWYEIVDYATDAEGNVASVLADNGTWYDVKDVQGIS